MFESSSGGGGGAGGAGALAASFEEPTLEPTGNEAELDELSEVAHCFAALLPVLMNLLLESLVNEEDEERD